MTPVQVVSAAVNAGKPLATHNEGWTATSYGVWAIFAAVVPVLLTGLYKFIPVMRKLAIEREATIDDERRGDMAEMRKRIDALEQKLEQQRAHYDAELAIMRHRANNATTCLDALLMLLKAAPDKVSEHIQAITNMREGQRLAEAAEKGAVSAAKIVAAGAPVEAGAGG